MVEREPQGENVCKGELYYLWHPGTGEVFSGYGLTMKAGRKDVLTGLLMVDRPHRADPDWLQAISNTFAECRLVAMTASGERGLACQMQLGAGSIHHLLSVTGSKTGRLSDCGDQPVNRVLLARRSKCIRAGEGGGRT